ncbi:MAG TPA: hypothetical protein VHE12_01920 [bacterium]|nr:hypothetical protein [bacterium]
MTIGTEGTRTLDPRAFLFLDLSHLLERVLRIWGVGRILHKGTPAEGPAYLPMERMVTLSGAVKGLLVVRSTREFALWLRSRRENTVLGRYPEEDIFEELVSLFCLYLVHSFWKPHLFFLGPIHPFPSIPADWPEETTRSAATMEIEGFPLEIRLWIDEGERL